jgi:hypothetical protein
MTKCHVRYFSTQSIFPPTDDIVGKGQNLSVEGPNYLPRFKTNFQGYLCCCCVPPATLARDITKNKTTPGPNVVDADNGLELSGMRCPSPPLLPAVHLAHEPEPQVARSSSPLPADISVERGSEMSCSSPPLPANVWTARGTKLSRFVIFSIGPKTDAAMDLFKFPHSFVPCRRHMVCMVRSGCWLQTLQAPKWSLGHEEAVTLSNALLADLEGTETSRVIIIFKP